MKKIVSMLLAVLLIVSFGLFALGSGDEKETADQGKDNAQKDSAQVDTDTASDDRLGDYSVVIESCRLAKDYAGNDVAIVKYIFGNVADEDAASFSWTIDDTVFQNGVSLEAAYVLADDANYSSDNQTKEIKTGVSLEVEVAYKLNDTTSDLEVEVSELISLDDKVIKKTFVIAN